MISNPSIQRTCPGKPGHFSHVKRYKGFPINQAFSLISTLSSQRRKLTTRCGLPELQPVINAAFSGLQTLMKDARGQPIR